jgi:hypothetical protein
VQRHRHPQDPPITESGLVPFPSSGPSSDNSLIAAVDRRDKCVANAIRLRRAAIHDEMQSRWRQREDCYRRADVLLDEFDELAETDTVLHSALTRVELRRQQSGTFSFRGAADRRARPYR